MSLNFVNLNEEVRQFMKKEVELDIQQNKLYISPRLTIGDVINMSNFY